MHGHEPGNCAYGKWAIVVFSIVLLMAIAGREPSMVFFNGLLHGINVEPISNAHLSVWMTILGLVDTFILSWLFGALVAVVYNGAIARMSTRP